MLIIRVFVCVERPCGSLEPSPRHHELLHNAITWPWKEKKRKKEEDKSNDSTGVNYGVRFIFELV